MEELTIFYLKFTIIVCIVTAIILCVVFMFVKEWSVEKFANGCITIQNIPFSELNQNVISMYLCDHQTAGVPNITKYCRHWGVICEIENDNYYEISLTRWSSMYIRRMFRISKLRFSDCYGNHVSNIVKKYHANGKYNIYSITNNAMKSLSENSPTYYSPFYKNCQHITKFILLSFSDAKEDDAHIKTFSGMKLFKRMILN